MDTNADIIYELLRKWNQPQELNAKCGIMGNTALHLAITAQNVSAIHSLLEAGASATVENENREMAVQLAGKLPDRTLESPSIEVLLAPYQHHHE